MLNLAGAYEFSNYPDQAPIPAGRLRFLAKAYDLMGYDALLVSRHERGLMGKAGVRPRDFWLGGGALETRILKAGKARVGLITLPDLPQPMGQAPGLPAGTAQEVEAAVRTLRAQSDLVVALSDWGYVREQLLLTGGTELPDILLGSGPGIGLVGQKMRDQRVMWIRSFSQGKGVERIDVLSWPVRNSTFKWTEEQNIRMSLDGLTDQYADDRRVLGLIRTMGTD